ncbi:MAG: hypothetical protein HKN16_10635 [Saprospiraceae bacterium]|nr:hypothetical protein [Saprospiraceae bacterium]
MQAYIFLIIFTLLIVKPTVNGLFLSRFGVEKLPYAFMLVAVMAGLVTTFYARIVRRIPLDRILNGTLALSVLSLLIFGLFLRFNILESLVLYVFFIWVAIFALLTTSQFWVLANIVFNAREAKRLFGYIGAGAIAGGILGGYFTSMLAQSMSSEFLPFWGALFLGLCIPLNLTIWKKFVDKRQSVFQQMKRTKGFGDHPFTLIKNNRHLSLLAAIVGISVMVAKLVDYQFGGIASELIPDQDELTAFFGFWLSTFSLISLIMQLFVTRRVVGTFGVGASLLFLPGSILIAVIALVLFPGILASAVLLKMSDSGLKQSVNKAAMELLILPIPANVKNQTKTFIDVFIDSLATGLSGLILILLVAGLDMSTNAINIMIMGLLAFWFYLIWQVKGEYLNSFRKKIDRSNNHESFSGFDLEKESVLKGLVNVLQKGSEYQKLTILEKINGFQKKGFYEPAGELLAHPSDNIKIAAIRHLYYYPKSDFLPEVESMTVHDNQEVQIAAFEYLVKHADGDRVEVMEKYLHQDDYHVRGAALVSLAKETRDNPELIKQFKLKNRIQGKLDLLPSIEDREEQSFRNGTALKTIGYANLPEFYPFVHEALKNWDKKLVREAITAAGNTLEPEFIPTLISFLEKPVFKAIARKALVNYGIGIVPALKRMINQGKLNLLEVRQVPSIVKEIESQQSVNFLFSLIDHEDFVVRHEALRGLNKLKVSFPQLRFPPRLVLKCIDEEVAAYKTGLSVLHSQKVKIEEFGEGTSSSEEARRGLHRLLEKRQQRTLERVFRLLGLIYPGKDIFIIYKGFRSSQSDLQTNAIEYLDNLLSPKLKKELIPLIESSISRESSQVRLWTLQLDLQEDFKCFQILLDGHDAKLKMAVLYLLQQLKDDRYDYMILEQTESKDPRVSDFAKKVMVSLG